MNKQSTIDLFKRFMKEKELWGMYIAYFHKCHHRAHYHKSVNTFLKIMHPMLFIALGFDAFDTSQGWAFWNRININWTTLYTEHLQQRNKQLTK